MAMTTPNCLPIICPDHSTVAANFSNPWCIDSTSGGSSESPPLLCQSKIDGYQTRTLEGGLQSYLYIVPAAPPIPTCKKGERVRIWIRRIRASKCRNVSARVSGDKCRAQGQVTDAVFYARDEAKVRSREEESARGKGCRLAGAGDYRWNKSSTRAQIWNGFKPEIVVNDLRLIPSLQTQRIKIKEYKPIKWLIPSLKWTKCIKKVSPRTLNKKIFGPL